MKDGKRWLLVATYALAMAWVEAAAVYYLRTMIGRVEPYQPNPLPVMGTVGSVELVRELATLVMLFTVGALAGRSWRARWGYMAVAFGVWDIFYYVFLKLICGWPHSWVTWDILFLIPLPWWGPVLAPMLIAALMIAWGTLTSQFDCEGFRFQRDWRSGLAGFIGVALALYLFMADALRVVGEGRETVRQVLPKHFAWGWFTIAIVMMSVPVVDLAWKVSKQRLISLRTIPGVNAGSRKTGRDFAKELTASRTIFE